MKKLTMAAVAAAALTVLFSAAPSQARMSDTGLHRAVQADVIDVQYRHGDRRHYRHGHHGHRHYNHRRHRHCWNERVRVRTPSGAFIVRSHRRCGWR